MNDYKIVKQLIKEAIDKLNLENQLDTDILCEICLEPLGLPAISAHTMLPTLISFAYDAHDSDYLKAINRLLSKNHIVRISYDGIEYFTANYLALGIKQEEIDVIKNENNLELNNLGSPHLTNATIELNQIFLNERSELFIALSITSIEAFQPHLTDRLNKGFKTTFFYPSKSFINQEQLAHYKEELQKWVLFITNLPKNKTKLIVFRIASIEYKELYTTLYSDGISRINVRNNLDDSSRKGTILQTNRGSSIHKMMKNSYINLMDNSRRYFKIDFKGYVIDTIKRNSNFIILVGLLFILLILLPLLSDSISYKEILQFFISSIVGLTIDKIIRKGRENGNY